MTQTENATGIELVPESMKTTFLGCVSELRTWHRKFSSILEGIEPPNAYMMPDDIMAKMDICKKHEAVLNLNIKTFVAQAKQHIKA